MRQLILDSLNQRLEDEISSRNPLKYLKEVDFEKHLDSIIGTVYLYTRPKRGTQYVSIYFTEVVCALGHSLRRRERLKKDSALAAKTGAFILYTFDLLGYVSVSMGAGHGGHQAYIVNVENDEGLMKLWEALPPSSMEKLPALEPYDDWRSYKHPTGAELVKTRHPVRKELTPETHPLIFQMVNRAQKVGWEINRKVYDAHLWALRNKTEAFNDIWSAHSREAKATKMRETKAIGSIATRYLDTVFYHLYTLDFRGRKYCNTAYLHEQGSDLAKGMLYRATKMPIEQGGFFWLCVGLASNWAGESGREDGRKTDKIPLQERFLWALDNEEILMSYAESPKVNQGWMKADKPWQFLAGCFELQALREHQKGDPDDFSYRTGLEVFIDGTNNGAQHLAALTRDEWTAPHVNLVPQELPGDLYMYVAEHTWDQLRGFLEGMTKKALRSAERNIDNIIEIKKRIQATEPRSEARKELVAELQAYRARYKPMIQRMAPVYWLRITDDKHKRKIVKRGTMTLPYGAKPYGLGEQVITDSRKHGIEMLHWMEHTWGAFFGRELFKVCQQWLERLMRLLAIFERAGQEAENRGEFLSWNVPKTNFPVVQHYVEGTVKKTWVQYGPPEGPKLNTGYYVNSFQLMISYAEIPKPAKGRQAQGASPNVIHSLDAAHLCLTCCAAPFPVTTIHDSFGCLLPDMPKLFNIVREQFVELYKDDPLPDLLRQLHQDPAQVARGDLDITLVLDSEYCFS